MNLQRISSLLRPRKATALQIVLLAFFLIVCGIGIVPSTAQSGQESSEERKFESTIPAHVPVKVKIKNEQAFKDMKNKKWARDLEIELRNTGSKPIYFIYMVMVLPDMLVHGNPSGFQITYGRKDLMRLTTPIRSDDMPIQPGESATLKISAAQVGGYERMRDEEKRHEPKKGELDLQLINFGDGTGLRSKQGLPLPNPAQKPSPSMPKLSDTPNASPPGPQNYRGRFVGQVP